MRWLLLVLVVSVCALIFVSGGVAWHIWRQHRKLVTPQTSAREESDIESEEAP